MLEASVSVLKPSIVCGSLTGRLSVPQGAAGLVVAPRVSGSSRLHVRTAKIERLFQARGFGLCTLDLLSFDEEQIDHVTKTLRHDTALLSERLVQALEDLSTAFSGQLPFVALLGLGDAAQTALRAAQFRPELLRALVVDDPSPDSAAHLERLGVSLTCLHDVTDDAACMQAAEWLADLAWSDDLRKAR